MGATANFLLAATGYDAILKAKQLGFSTILLLYSYFLATTYRNVLCGHISRDDKQNAEFLDVIEYIDEHAKRSPIWSRPATRIQKSKGVLTVPSLGSKIRFLSPVRGVGRGLPWAFVHLSELPWWGDMSDARKKEVVVGLSESMRPFGALVIESTPNMLGDVFGRICRGTDRDFRDSFFVHKYDWRYKWTRAEAAARRRRLGPRLFAREHGCDFVRAGDTLYEIVPAIWPDADPIGAFEGDDRKFWIGIDVASGAAEDRTVIRVIDPTTGRGYHRCGRWPYDDAADVLGDQVLPAYPGKALVELAGGYSDAFVLACRRKKLKLARGPTGRIGYPMTGVSKPESVRLLDRLFRDGAIGLTECHDGDRPEEEKIEVEGCAVLAEGKTGALPGAHDDHEAALRMAAICGQVRRPRIRKVRRETQDAPRSRPMLRGLRRG